MVAEDLTGLFLQIIKLRQDGGNSFVVLSAICHVDINEFMEGMIRCN